MNQPPSEGPFNLATTADATTARPAPRAIEITAFCPLVTSHPLTDARTERQLRAASATADVRERHHTALAEVHRKVVPLTVCRSSHDLAVCWGPRGRRAIGRPLGAGAERILRPLAVADLDRHRLGLSSGRKAADRHELAVSIAARSDASRRHEAGPGDRHCAEHPSRNTTSPSAAHQSTLPVMGALGKGELPAAQRPGRSVAHDQFGRRRVSRPMSCERVHRREGLSSFSATPSMGVSSPYHVSAMRVRAV
jgi:hypothetical protein